MKIYRKEIGIYDRDTYNKALERALLSLEALVGIHKEQIVKPNLTCEFFSQLPS